MLRLSRRSYVNINNCAYYNATDAKLDNPHSPSRDIPTLVREVREDRPRRKTPLRKLLCR